jgi:hypothetical protein
MQPDKLAICRVCGEPAGLHLENAVITHGKCLFDQLKNRRSKIPSDYGRKKNGMVSNELRKTV